MSTPTPQGTHSPHLLQGYLAALGTVAIWTGFIIISRLGGRSALTAYDILALRLSTASLLLLPFCRDLLPHLRDLRLWLLALIGGVAYGLLVYAGFKLTTAAHGAILLPGLQPFMVAALLMLMFGQWPGRRLLIGLGGIAAGIACAAVPNFENGNSESLNGLIGDGLVLGSSLAWALYSILAKRWSFKPWLLTRFVAIGSTVLFVPFYLLFLPKGLDQVPAKMLVLQGLYQGIGPTIVAMVLFLRAVSILGAQRTGALIALVPVFAGLTAVPVLGEPLSIWLLLGLALVSWGAFQAARH